MESRGTNASRIDVSRTNELDGKRRLSDYQWEVPNEILIVNDICLVVIKVKSNKWLIVRYVSDPLYTEQVDGTPLEMGKKPKKNGTYTYEGVKPN